MWLCVRCLTRAEGEKASARTRKSTLESGGKSPVSLAKVRTARMASSEGSLVWRSSRCAYSLAGLSLISCIRSGMVRDIKTQEDS